MSGARGFIGAATVRRLAGMPDVRVVALARARPAGAADPKVHWIESSLEDLTPSHWQSAGAPTCDALIHLAAFTPKSAAMRDCAAAIVASNIVGLQALLTSLPQPPRRLVFCSTLDVYALDAFSRTIDERSAVGPAGLYGLSKLFGEGLSEAYARSAGTEHVTIRLGHVFGPGEERYSKLVPETIRRVLGGKPPQIAGNGRERRDLLYVDDAAEALVRTCTAALDGIRAMNVARGESQTVRDIVTMIAALAGYRGEPESMPQSAPPYSTVFDTSLMTRVLGDWTFLPLAEGLRREIAHFRDMP